MEDVSPLCPPSVRRRWPSAETFDAAHRGADRTKLLAPIEIRTRKLGIRIRLCLGGEQVASTRGRCVSTLLLGFRHRCSQYRRSDGGAGSAREKEERLVLATAEASTRGEVQPTGVQLAFPPRESRRRKSSEERSSSMAHFSTRPSKLLRGVVRNGGYLETTLLPLPPRLLSPVSIDPRSASPFIYKLCIGLSQ